MQPDGAKPSPGRGGAVPCTAPRRRELARCDAKVYTGCRAECDTSVIRPFSQEGAIREPPKYARDAWARQREPPHSDSAAHDTEELNKATHRYTPTSCYLAVSPAPLRVSQVARHLPETTLGGRQSAALPDWAFLGGRGNERLPPNAPDELVPTGPTVHMACRWRVPLRVHRRPGIVLVSRPIPGTSWSRGHTCRTLRGAGSVGTRLGCWNLTW